MHGLTVLMDPKQRGKYLDHMLALDGLSHIMEDPDAAYCFISLTNTPEGLKHIVKWRQTILKERVLMPVGIKAYDPETAPFSPDKGLDAPPSEIYPIDSGKIVGARFFVGHNILPSSGQGIEVEKAKTFNRLAVVLMDKAIRVSRMQPHRAIYLQYKNFDKQAEEFRQVFDFLRGFDVGMGFDDGHPVLVGFPKKGGSPVNLEKLTYSTFPHLKYEFDKNAPTVGLECKNPELFYENER